ncbi:hypothetical protein [Nonomuraea sp. NPDC049141]|uniref:hypothetical protein n=1 Tax=Nonomuraea sp. NPDC049141 TaxID=3155500 RepID=UPI0033E6206E
MTASRPASRSFVLGCAFDSFDQTAHEPPVMAQPLALPSSKSSMLGGMVGLGVLVGGSWAVRRGAVTASPG